MKTLLKRKEFLENKIALSKYLMGTKQKEFMLRQNNPDEANEIQLSIENIRIETNKDQAALDEINQQIDAIPPTLARYEKTNPVFKDYAPIK